MRRYRIVRPVQTNYEQPTNESKIEEQSILPETLKKENNMSVSDKKFDVKLSLEASDVDGNKIVNSDVMWHSMDYDGLVYVERLLIESLAALNDAGVEKAKASGNGSLFELINKK